MKRLSVHDKSPYGCDNRANDYLYDGRDQKIDVSNVDVSMKGIELRDREFFAAIREGREPNVSVRQGLPCYRTLNTLEKKIKRASA